MPFAVRRDKLPTTGATSRTSSSSTTKSKDDQLELPISSPVAPPTAPPKRRAGTRQQSVSDYLAPIFNRLRDAKEIAYDSETSGLDWKNNHIVGHVLTFSPKPEDSHYLPVRHQPGGNLCDFKGPTTATNWDGSLHPIEKNLLKLLDRQDLTIVGHHLNFDLRFLYRLGYQFRNRCQDTMLNAALLNEYQGSYGLDYCARITKGAVQFKRSEEIKEYLCSLFPEAAKDPKQAMGHYWRLRGDDATGTSYAAGDGTTTLQLRDWQRVKLEQEELLKVWDVECRLIPVLARMSTKGIKIDEARLVVVRKLVKQRIDDLRKQFPGESFNVKSPIDVRHWMETNGVTDWPYTAPSLKFPDGQPSFNEEWLLNSEPGRQIVAVRKLTTLRDTFLQPLQTTHTWNGRVHATFNQLRGDEFGTITGRLSCSDPNLQAVTKHDEDIGRLHRSVFVADPGMEWAETDYEQLEPKLLAYYSNCRVLVDGYNADPPIDAHTSVAIACNPNWGNMTDKERKHYRNHYSKRINQTLITGGGKKVLVKKYKIDAREVDRVWRDYFRQMPEIKKTQKAMEGRMFKRGYLLTLLDRRCRLEDQRRAYVALNRALQGGNADILKSKLVEVDDYLESEGRPLDVLLNCHDAISFQYPLEAKKHLDECLRIMCSFEEDDLIFLDHCVPITLDTGYGPDWATATFGSNDPDVSRKVKQQYPEEQKPSHALRGKPRK